MTDCTFTKIEFPSCCKRRVEADFAGGEISSNGGALLLSLADRRQAGKVKHGLTGLLRQRVFALALALGDEDVNDHEVLRDDLVLQAACGGDRRLASPSTVGRLERAADRSWAWAAHETLVESFIASTEGAPEELVLDFDCTEPRRRGEGALRAPLLRPRRDGEPHQGAAAGPLRRPHQLPQVVAQPVPSDPLIARLYADRDDPPAGVEGHHDGPGSGGHYPPQAPEDRRRRHTQHPPRPPPSLQRLPVPGPGPSHGSQAQAGITDPFALPTQTHKRCRRLPARAPLAQNRPKQATTGNGTDNHQPESSASLKSANRKTRDPTSASKNPTLEPFVMNPG